MDNSLFSNYPLRGNPHFTKAIYYRLLLPSLLTNIDKLIYLDCDVVVNSSLSSLINTEMNNNLCMGVIDVLNIENQNRLHIDKYVNSGVLLIDLKKWRKYNIEKKFIEYINTNIDKIIWGDQDTINAVLNGKIDYLDSRWNVQLTEYTGGKTEYFRNMEKDALIIHFISDKKPWKFCKNKYEKYYYKYAKKSPWKPNILIHIYNSNFCRKLLKVNFLQKLFSIKNSPSRKHKILRILGLKISFKRKLFPLECRINDLQNQIFSLQDRINRK